MSDEGHGPEDDEIGTFEGESVLRGDGSGDRELRGKFSIPKEVIDEKLPTGRDISGVFVDDRAWAKLRDRTFVALAIFAMVAFGLTSFMVIKTNQTVSEINENQIHYVQAQNDAQLCAQHDIVLAVKSIGHKLGLPVNDIPVPSIEGLACP